MRVSKQVTDLKEPEHVKILLAVAALEPRDALESDHLAHFVIDYANQKVLAALAEVKSCAEHSYIIRRNTNGAEEIVSNVPVSAIEEIERKYK